ncbi:MAG TPA: hypothetical protein ENN99_16500 [Chloroflexi bacterium]|nr:hypothetical protein [Chloroflexota bacterium]
MADLVFDVGALADLLAQYFQAENRLTPQFHSDRFLPDSAVRRVNRIVQGDGRYILAASAMAFVELARKWDDIVAGRFLPHQLAAFIHAPPDWFSIEPVDRDLVPLRGEVPPDVLMPDGTRQSVELPDTIHLATVLSREKAELITSDQRLVQMMDSRIRGLAR